MLAALLAASLALAAQVRDVDGYLGRMDADGDGRVSLAEYQAWMGYGFDALDRNHDGVLSTSELPGGHGAPLTRDAHHARLAAAFARQDRNRDGVLDATELAAPPR
jgi:Ca2+-binding EF-hand superfamily protein